MKNEVIILFLECERDRTVFLFSFQGVTAFLRERFRRSWPISVATVHRFWMLHESFVGVLGLLRPFKARDIQKRRWNVHSIDDERTIDT